MSMGLEDLVEDDPRHEEGYCPNCGAKGEETDRPELRCPTPSDECEVVYWFDGSFEEAEEAYNRWH